MINKDVKIGNPADAAKVKQFVAKGPQPAESKKKEETRLTVDIPVEVHEALAFARTRTKRQMKEIVTEALRAHPDVAQFLPGTE